MLKSVAPYSEEELLLHLSQGRHDAFEEIYRLYAERLITYAFNILQDKDTCRDVIHDIFLTLWTKRASLIITTSLSAYLFAAARNQIFQVIRKDKTREAVFTKIEQRIWGESIAETQVYQKELQERLVKAVSRLPEKAQLVYRLSREQQLSHKEIAEKLQISVKTVENHLTASLRKIRENLGDLLPLLILFI